MFDFSQIKSDFPILFQEVNGFPLVYLDNAATTQKPVLVIDTISDYYRNYNSNVHRGVHTLSQRATERYEATRDKIKDFIGAEKREEIIFTKNDTESLNLVAQKWGEANLHAGDEIILSSLEHHSNIVPWQLIAQKTGAKINFVQLKDNSFDYDHFKQLLSDKTKVVSLSQGSNVTGEILDFNEIIPLAKQHNAIIVVDAGQTASHNLVNLKTNLQGVDFVTMSSHKMYGPTGVGILYGKEELLNKMEPLLGGGDMIKEVFEDHSTWNDLPYKFEAGTPNIADVIGLGSALLYMEMLNKDDLSKHEDELTQYTLGSLSKLSYVEIYHANNSSKKSLPIVSFNVKGVHSHDVGSILDSQGIAVRTGHHCAQPLMAKLGQEATVRASMAMYNTKTDIDKLIEGLDKVKTTFKI